VMPQVFNKTWNNINQGNYKSELNLVDMS